ncbi:MAG: VCBS repeat-containing protein [Verrucomicrobia bacterium]|nr:VCBS repeat-containing protein [Verrucomicrobiota bacterium]
MKTSHQRMSGNLQSQTFALLLSLTGTVLAFDWQPGPGHRSAALPVPKEGKPGFTLMPESLTGLHFTNHLARESAGKNQIRMNGSGVALGDIDGDGWRDIYLCRLEGDNKLYRNHGGWKFDDITAQAGVVCPGQYSTGCALADLDGDGDLDLLVNSIGGGTRCFFNDGQGRFTERNSGLLRKFTGQTLALGDIDGNGTLDLYVANYRSQTVRSTGIDVLTSGNRTLLRQQDREDYELTPQGALLEHGEPDALYLNDGHGNFTPLSWTEGRFLDADGKPLTRADRDWGLSVMFRDLNGDGAPDIYVCNDFHSDDAIWLNDGQGRFRAIDKLALRHTPTFSMGIDFADINRDGLDDFFVLDMLSPVHQRRMTQRAMLGSEPAVIGMIDDRPQADRNNLFLNRGDGTYAEIGQLAMLQSTDWSWCPVFLDVDLDGYEDLLVVTGHLFDTQDADAEARISAMGPRPNDRLWEKLLHFPPLTIPNQAFRNHGDLTFEDASQAWGFNLVGISQGIALADLDNDGDLDVVLNNLNSAAALLRNEVSAPRLAVRLKGQSPNTRGIGAKIKVLGGPRPQSQEMMGGGRFLSCDDAERVFAGELQSSRFQVPGSPSAGLAIEVTWRSGAKNVVSNAQPNRIYEIDEAGAARMPNLKSQISNLKSFRDVSALLNHVHHEDPFDDLARQPLLPKRLSQMGPGVSWLDLDSDGREDLLITSGRGGEIALFHNGGDGRFARFRLPTISVKARDDQATALGWSARSGTTTLLLGQSNYERDVTNAPAAAHFEISAFGIQAKPSFANLPATTGPMTLADVDGDGDLDLFVGGTGTPGRYPEPASSSLFRNDAGTFVLAQTFTNLGLARGAVFSDLDGDGFSELIVSVEWGPIRIFRNQQGLFTPWDWRVSLAGADRTFNLQPLTLNDLTGWWQGVTAGDFDGDGRLDLAAANWGRNSAYQRWLRDGIRVHYADWTGGGRIDGLEAYVVDGRVVPWRDLDSVSKALPWLREQFKTFRDFGQATIGQVLAGWAGQPRELRVNWLDSTLFLNRGDHLEVRPLPIEAQFAPAFDLTVADFDGDGWEDLFLAQNFFALEPLTPRYDAGRGLLLRGAGRSGFTAVPGQESGLLIYGEQRGAAASDYDGDGRVDLAVSQNGAATKLFHNETARPGLRVKLEGPDGNPAGVGAVVRLVNGLTKSPARELHAGSGWWSQDSAVQVLGAPFEPKQLQVRWPGGKATTSEVPAGAREITVDSAGQVKARLP